MVYSSYRFGAGNTYSPDDMLTDAESGIWSELATKKPIDLYRRNLQKAYAEGLINLLSPSSATITISFGPSSPIGGGGSVKSNDVVSIARAHLISLRSRILGAVPGTSDKLSRYHLQDVADRIQKALDPK
jgi:hypothetical protein